MDNEIETVKKIRALEAFLEIAIRILGLAVVYIIFEYIGSWLLENFLPDMLLSIVVLPAIYVLKDAYKIMDPFTVSIKQTETDISVKRGFLSQTVDKLLFKAVDNIEVTQTLLGRIFHFKTIVLYSAGGFVELPFVKSVHAEKIENKVTELAKRC